MINGMFTDRVKKVMQIAREEAVRLGNDYVGTEHLLLGLIKEGDGVAVAVLRSMGIDLDELAANIEKAITSTGGMMTIGQMLPFTPRAKKVLEIAANEARSMSHKYIGTEHLLLALMKDTESTASNALASSGLEYDRVKEEISRVLRGGEKTIRRARVLLIETSFQRLYDGQALFADISQGGGDAPERKQHQGKAHPAKCTERLKQ